MNKGDSLRAFLTSSIVELKDDTSRLLVFADKGRVVSTAAGGLSFEYRYTLQLVLLDFAGDLDVVFAATLAWLGKNQPELLANFDKQKDAVRFDAEILDDDKADLTIDIDLTERIRVVPRQGGGFECAYMPEPDYPAELRFGFNPDTPPPATMSIYQGDQLVAEWPGQ